MRLVSEPKDKKFENNLRLLYACSKISEISLQARNSELQHYKDFLNSSEAREFVEDFFIPQLKHIHQKTGSAFAVPTSPEDLLSFCPDEDRVPPIYADIYQRHRAMYKNNKNFNSCSTQLSEHKQLQQLIATIQESIANGTPYDENTIQKFLQDEKRSKAFKNFASSMLDRNPGVINRKYSQLAKSIAQKNNLYTESFRKNLSATLKEPKVALHRETRSRAFTTAKKLIPALALSAGIAIGAYWSPRDTYEAPVAPIAGEQNPNTQETAYKNFYKKTAEIYKNNTGKEIDLSNLNQDNINQYQTTIFTVKYQGKTYYFSSQSPYDSNYTYLEKALKTLPDAEITTARGNITSISSNGKSIAITDSNGNPIQSGNILESATSGVGQMYNQTYVNIAKKTLASKGVDISSLSEAELIAKFLVSDMHNEQNPELSKALGETIASIHTLYYPDKDGSEHTMTLRLNTKNSPLNLANDASER